ncbi:MAG TPA: twin-arginine translocase subunit TatC [Actinomycetota bacterium]|nr:twin-arginine translocase subunit TatC [Actinomycetota bacterium]
MRVIPERWHRRRRRDAEGTMTLVEHLEELRYRLIVSLVAVALGGIVGWGLYDRVLELIQDPYCDYYATVPEGIRPTDRCALFFAEPLGSVVIKLKIVAFLGLFFALPVVLLQLWRFIVPGLTKRERRLGVAFVISSVVLFGLGALFAYWSLPRALGFLLGFGGQQIVPLLTADRFFSFVMLVAFSFGIGFEFPIVLIFLNAAGIVSTDQLRSWRRGAILFIFVFGAIITPSGDPYTLLALGLPMVLFYEAAIIVGRLLKR